MVSMFASGAVDRGFKL